MIPYISGRGGSGAARMPKEARNSLRSSQTASVVELLSEGEIAGLCDTQGNILPDAEALKAVYIDNVALMSPDGTYNIDKENVSFQYTRGTNYQASINLTGGSGAVRASFAPDFTDEITHALPNGAIQTIGNPDNQINAIVITIGTPALFLVNKKKGDTEELAVYFRVFIQHYYNGVPAGWVETLRDNSIPEATRPMPALAGKCTTRFQKEFEIPVDPNASSFQVKIIRHTPDRSTSSDPDFVDSKYQYNDAIFFDLYTTVKSISLRYPNSAIACLTLDSEAYSNIPTRAYLLKGIKVRVPTTYDEGPGLRDRFPADTIWDGTFKTAWTDNPAWIYYDLVTNPRYGLGNIIDAATQVDKWSLYEIGKYCDQLVPNGGGGYEHRFTCNTWITQQQDIYTLLNSITSIFRGMQYWSIGHLTCMADMPRDPVAHFTHANVVEGVFNYSGTSAKNRHTVAQVTWNNPLDMFKQQIEYVEDQRAVAQYGIIKTDIVAVGCTSRGQAHRVGKWLLYTELYETETITFRAGLDAAVLRPGDVIEVSDPDRHGQRYGGRITSVNSVAKTLGLDGSIPNGSYKLTIFTPTTAQQNDQPEPVNVPQLSVYSGTISSNVFTSSTSFGTTPEAGQVWTVTPTSVEVKEQWRILNVKDSEEGDLAVTGMSYYPGKFDLVEQGIALVPQYYPDRLQEGLDIAYKVPTNFTMREYATALGTIKAPGSNYAVDLAWSGNTPKYEVAIRRTKGNNTGDWVFHRDLVNPMLTINHIDTGLYEVSITGHSADKARSTKPLITTFKVIGPMNAPSNVADFTGAYTQQGITLKWSTIQDEADLKSYVIRRYFDSNSVTAYNEVLEYPGPYEALDYNEIDSVSAPELGRIIVVRKDDGSRDNYQYSVNHIGVRYWRPLFILSIAEGTLTGAGYPLESAYHFKSRIEIRDFNGTVDVIQWDGTQWSVVSATEPVSGNYKYRAYMPEPANLYKWFQYVDTDTTNNGENAWYLQPTTTPLDEMAPPSLGKLATWNGQLYQYRRGVNAMGRTTNLWEPIVARASLYTLNNLGDFRGRFEWIPSGDDVGFYQFDGAEWIKLDTTQPTDPYYNQVYRAHPSNWIFFQYCNQVWDAATPIASVPVSEAVEQSYIDINTTEMGEYYYMIRALDIYGSQSEKFASTVVEIRDYSNVLSNITVAPRVGALQVTWDMDPSDNRIAGVQIYALAKDKFGTEQPSLFGTSLTAPAVIQVPDNELTNLPEPYYVWLSVVDYLGRVGPMVPYVSIPDVNGLTGVTPFDRQQKQTVVRLFKWAATPIAPKDD